jgi:ubiquinone/menaquinone biosynthesis C-methylase UbiE
MSKASPAVTHPSAPRIRPCGEIRDDDAAVTSTAEARVIAANKDFYSQIAKKYEQYESCTFEPYLQQILDNDLDTIQSWFTSLGRTPHCLDCGGGTGNLALKMLARGWNVTVVDVSAEMLAVLKEKARAAGHSPRLVHSSIERFLEERHETYDLVAFSSVLHHLYSYASIVQQAAAAVCPDGIFYSNYDPIVPQTPFWTRAFNTLDIAVAKTMFDPSDVLPGIGRRFLKAFTRIDPLFRRKLVSAGDLAEYRAHTGVNDAEVIRLLRINGFAIVEHLRYPTGRTGAVRLLNEKFRFLEYFKIIARRDSGFIRTAKTLQSGTSVAAVSE